MIRDYQQLIRQRITERVASYSQTLADGGARDYADYRDRVGRIKGLEEAREIVDEALKELSNDDDD